MHDADPPNNCQHTVRRIGTYISYLYWPYLFSHDQDKTSELMLTCIERRLEPLFERDSSGGRRFVAPRPANKLFSNDGERAQMNAWNDETVNTPSLFKIFFVGRDT